MMNILRLINNLRNTLYYIDTYLYWEIRNSQKVYYEKS